ncbi:Fe-S cluster assembly sulfur transfer protein SufU [Marinobacterium aestuariivivens]|uniref:Fe-S cluster assembly sulfur transfer protein SufU n=1 Tax=Marinobacterium aestuariivivens TaxID=1698799 RepID=A0ABW2A786_9GAMM
MDPELRELYQEVIIDHGRHPRNFRRLDGAGRCREGYNPICGDQLELCIHLSDDGRIDDVAFQGQGCAISMASASLLTETVRGMTGPEARALVDALQRMLHGEALADDSQLGKLRVLAGVREFPSRVKCATLSWHALLSALEPHEADDPVSTE